MTEVIHPFFDNPRAFLREAKQVAKEAIRDNKVEVGGGAFLFTLGTAGAVFNYFDHASRDTTIGNYVALAPFIGFGLFMLGLTAAQIIGKTGYNIKHPYYH